MLEDQLAREQARTARLEEEKAQLQNQIQAYRNFVEVTEQEPAPEGGSETAGSRRKLVMDAAQDPRRFPNLRFLGNAGKSLAAYGKPRPTGEELLEALGTIDALAGLYLGSGNGNVGPWKEHLQMSGWTYANAESEATMGKHPQSRRFRDQRKRRHITVQRHLTHRGSSSGLQIFFDSDGEGEPFIIAYMGEHLPYVTSRS